MTGAASDPVRLTELSAYFTHCQLQPVHLILALRSAMGTAFKTKVGSYPLLQYIVRQLRIVLLTPSLLSCSELYPGRRCRTPFVGAARYEQ